MNRIKGYRFKTLQDAENYSIAMAHNDPEAAQYALPEYLKRGNQFVANPEWVNAPYEEAFLYLIDLSPHKI